MSSICMKEHFRPGWAESHDHPNKEFLARHRLEVQQAMERGGGAVRELLLMLVRRIADTRNLRIAFDYLRASGGHAPGPDGLTYGDLCEAEVWALLRLLSKLILAGKYVPGPLRKARIPKGANRGYRTLWLANIADRVVARAIVQIIEPLLAVHFSELSFCRGGQGPLKALAKVDRLQREGQHGVWITEDVQDMFEHIPLRRLLQIVAKRLPDVDVVELIERVISRPSGKGLRQGSPLSPLLANLYMDHLVDRRWAKLYPGSPLLRYMDDLLLLCDNGHEPDETHGDLARICQDAAMPLKYGSDASIRRLGEGEEARWLGYRLTLSEGEVQPRLALDHAEDDCLFHRLHDRLVLLHEKPDAPLRAFQVIEGLMTYAAPCFAHSDPQAVYREVSAASRAAAFTEIPTLDDFTAQWRNAHENWRERCAIWDAPKSCQSEAWVSPSHDHDTPF